MSYRFKTTVSAPVLEKLRSDAQGLERFVAPVIQEGLEILQAHAVRNLSGFNFNSETGGWTIQKRSGLSAASVRTQYPYGSNSSGRVFAYRPTRYAGNPETYNVLKILEEGRGEIVPKYTPSMKNGEYRQARLTIPTTAGGYFLASGLNGFRGASGNYRFVKRIAPAQGRYWLKAAATTAAPEIQKVFSDRVRDYVT